VLAELAKTYKVLSIFYDPGLLSVIYMRKETLQRKISMTTITPSTNSISVTLKNHHNRLDHDEYVFEHTFQCENKTFNVYVSFCPENKQVVGCFQQQLFGKEADIHGRWKGLFSTWKPNSVGTYYEELSPKLPSFDSENIKVVKAETRHRGEKLHQEYVVNLFRIGEYLVREHWKGSRIVFNYGTERNTLDFDKSQLPNEPQEHDKDTCMCYSCHNSRYLRKYSGGYNSRALSPSSCGGSGSDRRYEYQHDERNAALERQHYENGNTSSYDPYEHGGYV
jgi:hypothetical protein